MRFIAHAVTVLGMIVLILATIYGIGIIMLGGLF